MSGLAVGVVVLPLLAGALVATASWCARPVAARRISIAGAGLTALCVLALLLCEGGTPVTAIEWLPGAGSMGLAAGATNLYAVLAIACTAFLVLLGASEYSPLAGAVMLVALAAANAAFLTDHFLARYVALEIVALCVPLLALVEVQDSTGIRLASSGYLLLRLGDAGLLAAILVLKEATGTLGIAPALEAGLSLDEVRLRWAATGFLLAVWVKLGGWPLHLWSQVGRRLSLASQAWLYATVVPNLGAYLLYRVAPLLSSTGYLQMASLWLGAGGAAVAALVALTQPAPRSALVYIGAVQGGLALFAGAAGLKSAVWVGMLVLTPVRLLLFLTAGVAQKAGQTRSPRAGACLFALGGLALSAFGLLTTWWAREAGVPLDALFVAQAAVALIGVWTAQTAWRLSRPLPGAEEGTAVHWTQWATVGLLGGVVLAGGLAFGPLVAAGPMPLPSLPTLLTLLRYAATAPALLAVLALSLATWRLQRRSGQRPLVAVEPVEEAYDLEEGLARAAQVLRAVVEVGIAERIVGLVVRAVVSGARVAWTVEHKGLEEITSRSARAVVDGALVAHRVVEREGLEGLLQRAVCIVVALSRVLQRWHTGRLRRNLLWVPIALALAVLTLVVYGW
jgi:NADH-quinone oxidoreductase subunit L